uniref:Uncharacterized protein n=1 Tax=Glossina palpalis gambiensis TaxID=67801 RepID=A0A1B0BIV6_9MUSC
MRLVGKKIVEISVAVNWYRNVVSNYLKHSDKYSRIKHSGVILTVDQWRKRKRIRHLATNEIKAKLVANLRRHRVQQLLKDAIRLGYEHKIAKPRFTLCHKNAPFL